MSRNSQTHFKMIHFHIFKVCLTILGRYALKSYVFLEKVNGELTFIFPVDTGRKLNVHKTFKRPTGGL